MRSPRSRLFLFLRVVLLVLLVVLASEAAIRKEISHGLAMAAHRVATHQAVAATAAAGRPSQVIPHPSSVGVGPAANGHAVPAAVVPAVGAPLTPAAFALAAAEAGNYSLKDISREAARQAERELILKMLQHTRWNRKETAEILGISYKALLYKIKENGLDKAS